MRVHLIKAKSVLNKSKLPDSGFTLNPYFGCSHACVYCYNQQFISRIRKNQEKWGQFLDVKINAPKILVEELAKKKRADWVFLSTVTDPYNQFEAKYQITRQCLEILLKYQWPVSILTKSILILRDIDLLKQFKQIEVGFTFTTLNNKFARLVEPQASLPTDRLNALTKLHQTNIRTYAFIAPILPQLTDLNSIFKNLKGKVDEIWFDTLNTKKNNWLGLKRILLQYWPQYLPVYKQIFFENRRDYKIALKKNIKNLSQKYYLPIKICF